MTAKERRRNLLDLPEPPRFIYDKNKKYEVKEMLGTVLEF